MLPPLRHARGMLTVHDLAFLMHPECADSRLRAYLDDVVPRSVRRADFVIADSENTRNDLVVLLGVAPDRVEVVPGGVEAALHAGRRTRSCSRRRASALVLATRPSSWRSACIEPRKNLNRLMDAFAELKRARHAART